MKRSTFLFTAAILGFALGLTMFFTPDKTAQGFGVESTPIISILFRAFGIMIFGSALIFYLIRNHADNPTFKVVLLVNFITHILGLLPDILSVKDGLLEFMKILPGQLLHLFIAIGSLIYYRRMN